MLTTNELLNNKNTISNFLINRPIPEKYRLTVDKIPFGYIYCIENKLTGMKYIGSTYSVWAGIQKPRPYTSLSKRASHYLYEYNKAMKSITAGNKVTYRPIIQAMIDNGFNNFIMYPICETTPANHTGMENYFIDIYDTIKSGYNVSRAGVPTATGRVLTARDKQIRSEGIIAVNMNDKKLVVSESMKLLGDYIGTTKDQIKNGNRNGKPVKGWFIFYLNPDKRHEILFKNVIHDQNKRKQERHSDKAKSFYIGLYNAIELHLNETYHSEYFPGFERLPNLIYTD